MSATPELPSEVPQQSAGLLHRAQSSPALAMMRRVFSIDYRSLAVFRILLALLILLDLAVRAFDMRAFYTDDGVLPRSYWLLMADPWHTSIHGANGQLWWQILLFSIAAAFALGLLAGWRTRWMAVGSFFMLLSLINRNGQVVQAGDLLLVIMAFWSLFLPLAARFSVDAALQSEREATPNPHLPLQDDHFSMATIAVILQVLFLYVFTALLKTGDAWRVNFDAAFYAVSLQHFATPVGTWIAQFPALLKASTVYVLAVEFLAPVLVLLPFAWPWARIIGWLMLASLHAAFLLMLHIGLFPLIDFMALSLLIPGAVWAWLGRRPANRRLDSIVIYYDRDCGFCLKMCLILREFLLPPSVHIVPAQSDPVVGAILERENSWVVQDAGGGIHLHWQAMQFLFSRRWPFKPIGWLMAFPPFMAIGHRLYRTIAANRATMGDLSARFLPYRKLPRSGGPVSSALALFFLVLAFLFNLGGLPGWQAASQGFVDSASRFVRIDQRWGMFAPFPLVNSFYPVITATLRNGDTVDVYPLTSHAPSWTAPPDFHSLYEGYRWRKYFEHVQEGADPRILEAFGSYLCRQWNRPGLARERQAGLIDVSFDLFTTNTTGAPKARTRRSVWQHWCFPEFKPR